MRLIDTASALPPTSDPHAVAGMPPRSAATARPPVRTVAESYFMDEVPLGLGLPKELRGGDRLSPSRIRDALGFEWNVELLSLVDAACRQQLESGRPWFRMEPVVLSGPTGAGRTHVARRLAHEAGVPHVAIDLADATCGFGLGCAARGPTSAAPSPLAIAMAMSGCANPVIGVTGVEHAAPEVLARLLAAIDPMDARLHDEALRSTLDLSEATWLLQVPPGFDVPPDIGEIARIVPLSIPADTASIELAWIETLIEVAVDRDLEGRCGAVDLSEVSRDDARRPGRWIDAAARYRVAMAAFDAAYGRDGGRINDGSER